MSKLTDYSKFDHLVESDDEQEEQTKQQQQPPQPPQQQPPPPPVVGHHKKDPTTGRYIFYYGTQKVYEWEQTLETVTLYVDAPSPQTTTAKDFIVNITTKHLQIGLSQNQNQFFLDDDFYSLVDKTESCWFLEDNHILQIVLQKQKRAETWECVLQGEADNNNDNNPLLKQEVQQQILLERFQEENPGMDFRDATFNGSVPDPRTYMGGIGYNG